MTEVFLQGRRLVLGVTGSIAAYKAVDLLRRLTDQGATVTVAMTAGAARFVTPLTFQTLSRRRVYTDLFEDVGAGIPHLTLTEEAELLLIAPATADFIARAACGLADDLLSAVFLAARVPVVMAPAMDYAMWESPVTQRNLATLRGLGVRVVEPEAGWLASGASGPGRLADVDRIMAAVLGALTTTPRRRDDLAQEVVLVTAGPTWEALDPVRGLSNRSSGRMGYAVAEAARDRGARVVLISGATALTPPSGIEVVHVETVEQMRHAVARCFPSATIVVMAAAPSDYRPAAPSASKLKKGPGRLTLELEETPDILRELGAKKGGRLMIGFALETDRPLEHARRKLEEKRLDLVVANGITAIGGETTEATILTADGRVQPLPAMSKRELAERLLDRVVELICHRRANSANSANSGGSAA